MKTAPAQRDESVATSAIAYAIHESPIGELLLVAHETALTRLHVLAGPALIPISRPTRPAYNSYGRFSF